QFTLRVEGNDRDEIDAALDDGEINLIFLGYDDDGKLVELKAAANMDAADEKVKKNVKVESISSTRITVNDRRSKDQLTLAADVFYWDAADEEFIRRVDIDEGD